MVKYKTPTAAVLAAALLTSTGSAAYAQADTCANLKSRLENSSKSMAMIYADGIGDDSAPRATMRELKELNLKVDQLILLEFMKEHDCEFESAPPSMSLYLSSALECANDQLQGNYESEKCKRDNWTPSGGEE